MVDPEVKQEVAKPKPEAETEISIPERKSLIETEENVPLFPACLGKKVKKEKSMLEYRHLSTSGRIIKLIYI